MSPRVRQGTQGYSAEAPELLREYERFSFEDSHGDVLALIPPPAIEVLDIGAGTGRDAAWFGARGDRVTAIEPTREMREGGRNLHPEPNITWIDDGLPELTSVRGRAFDLVWMSAVWMHFDAEERASTFPTVAGLVKPGGALMMTLRHGPIPEGRRMFDVTGEETIALAAPFNLTASAHTEADSARRPGISWTRLWLTKAQR